MDNTDWPWPDSLAEPPAVMWSEALPPHALQNVGDIDIRLVSVELKETAPTPRIPENDAGKVVIGPDLEVETSWSGSMAVRSSKSSPFRPIRSWP